MRKNLDELCKRSPAELSIPEILEEFEAWDDWTKRVFVFLCSARRESISPEWLEVFATTLYGARLRGYELIQEVRRRLGMPLLREYRS
jgi:hypothetical protein